MHGRVRREIRRLRKPAYWILGLWVGQLACMCWFFMDSAWDTYWFCRYVYGPGVRLFGHVGRGILPGYFFNPFSPRGVMISFAFAALTYAAVTVLAGYWLRRRVGR